jgi:hypothetical protein
MKLTKYIERFFIVHNCFLQTRNFAVSYYLTSLLITDKIIATLPYFENISEDTEQDLAASSQKQINLFKLNRTMG